MALAATKVSRQERWRPRPVASWSIRVAVFVVPVALGFLASLLVSRAQPRPHDAASLVLWWAVLAAVVLAVVISATAACRRFLPLAALLDLSLLFPDKAPSRFALARQTGSVRHLARQVEELREQQPAAEAPQVRRNENILALVAALSVHDRRTRGHSERVRIYTDMLSEQLGLSAGDRDRLRWASMLHDIGKLVVPAELLNKPALLDEDEWAIVHRHPLEGARILEPLRPWLGEWAAAAEHHHEWWDGSGYPRGLKHDEISRAGRIVAVADAYETMTSARPYQRTLTPLAARRELVAQAGRQFDPRMVRAFLEISAGRLWRAVGLEALIAEIPLLAPVVWVTGRLAGWSAPAAATAGTIAVLAAGGFLGPSGLGPAEPGMTRQFSVAAGPADYAAVSAPATGGTAFVTNMSTPGSAKQPGGALQAAGTGAPNAPASSPQLSSLPGTSVSGAGVTATGHGASAFTPGHGYGPPPGRGGTSPGVLLATAA